jgi:alpha-L-glutamate ligase-like protein
VIFRRLREAGVLGINARNSEVIARWNPRRNYPNVDDKLRARSLAVAAGARVPRLVAEVAAYGDVRRLPELLAGERDFVVKPVKGAMGNGVLVVTGRDGDRWVRSDGARLDPEALGYHVAGILAGLYSLGGHVDRAMVEERLVADAVLGRLSFGGVPDVRVIVFRGVPVLAMTRLPTRESRGRANLHQGAVAAGISLATGRTTGGVHHDRPAAAHPDSGESIVGVEIPAWEELLPIAARCADAFGLWYLGVDLVIDARHRPVLLEANARPGLAIQLACARGLWPRLRAVEAMELDGLPPEARVELGRGLADT